MRSLITRSLPCAARVPGFVWRLTGAGNNATDLRAADDPTTLVNISVWTTAEAVFEFVYRSRHAKVMARRREWFEKLEMYLVLYWIPAGHLPTIAEASAPPPPARTRPVRPRLHLQAALPGPRRARRPGQHAPRAVLRRLICCAQISDRRAGAGARSAAFDTTSTPAPDRTCGRPRCARTTRLRRAFRFGGRMRRAISQRAQAGSRRPRVLRAHDRAPVPRRIAVSLIDCHERHDFKVAVSHKET